MCITEYNEVLHEQNILKEGIELGRAQQIIEDGMEDGKSKEEILKKLVRMMYISEEIAEKYYDEYVTVCV